MDSGVKPGNDEEKERRHYCRDHLLTFVPFIVTSPIISPARTPPGDTGGEGRGGSRGRGCQPRSRAALGQNARPARRPACGLITPAALGRPGVGNTRSSLVPSQEVRELELSGGVRSLPQVPWWNAGRRARPRAERAAQAAFPWRALCAACVQAVEYRVCRRSASFLLFVRSPDEQSEIRDGLRGFSIVPAYRSAHAGYGWELRRS